MRRLSIAVPILAALAASVVIAVTAAASPRGGASIAPSAPSARIVAAPDPRLTADVLAARLATAPYATSLRAAEAAGYKIITRMIPNMGWHFMNASVTGFDVRKPPILVYERRGHTWQLGALEWVFTSMPAEPPYREPSTACSAPRATTPTAPSCSQIRSRSAHRRVRRRARRSTSGIRG
jgi:hypothetical protein